MAHNILSRLQQAKQPEVTSGAADRVYESMMAEIRTKATSDARLAVQSELDAARSETAAAHSETTRVEAERDAARSLHDAAEKRVLELKTKAKQLTAALVLEQTSFSQQGEQIKNKEVILKSELTDERLKVNKLEIEVSNLNGKLSVKPKQVSQVKPSPIPSFTVSDVTHGADNRINGATITPVRLN